MIIKIDANSDTGCIRDHNEDMILVHNEQIRDNHIELQVETDIATPFIYAVADGMGGHNGGEFASELATHHLEDAVHELQADLSSRDLSLFFNQWIQDVHQLVIQKGIDIPEFYNMGTTLAGMLIYNNRYYWMNIGDSRIYRFRGGILTQISIDHSMSQMYDLDAPSNIICNSIGAGKEVFIDFNEIPVILDGDVFLLCSDGLTDMIPAEQIEMLLSENQSSTRLVEAAKQAGGKDNISVLLLHFFTTGEPVAKKDEDRSKEEDTLSYSTEDTSHTKAYGKTPLMEARVYREIIKNEEEETTASDVPLGKNLKEDEENGFLNKLNRLFGQK